MKDLQSGAITHVQFPTGDRTILRLRLDRSHSQTRAIAFLPVAGGWGDGRGDRFPGLTEVKLMISLELAGFIFVSVKKFRAGKI